MHILCNSNFTMSRFFFFFFEISQSAGFIDRFIFISAKIHHSKQIVRIPSTNRNRPFCSTATEIAFSIPFLNITSAPRIKW
jgi:hypothetical protein